MGYEHSSLLWLPDAMRAEGLNVIELDGWKENEQGYYWSRLRESDGRQVHDGYIGDPRGWVWHHTATNGYTPFVKNGLGQTKANIFMGMWQGGSNYRLYNSDAGQPTAVIVSAGPSDYSNGSGYKPVLIDHVEADIRFYGPQKNSDSYPKFYGNRFMGGTEIVHPGNGSPVNQGVFRMAYITASLLSEHYEWSIYRNIGHLDWSRRKIDPRFEQGSPYTMGLFQDAAEGFTAGTVTPPPTEPIPPPTGDYEMHTVVRGDGYNSKGTAEKRPTVKAAQLMLAHWGFADKRSEDGTCAADGIFGSGTESAAKNFQVAKGLVVDGKVGPVTWAQLESW